MLSKAFRNKYFFHILFFGILLILFLINNKSSHSFIGLDNISPFWGLDKVFYQTVHSDSYFNFGPILFSWWFGFLSIIGLNGSTISSLYLWGYLIIGIVGYNLYFGTKKASSIATTTLIIFGSLVTLWIFASHQLMFMSLFTSLPYILLALNTPWRELSLTLKTLVIFIFLPMFFSSSINLSSFFFALIFLLIYSFLKTKVENKQSIKDLVIKYSILVASFLVLTQSIILFSGHKSFIVPELVEHSSKLLNNSYSEIITKDSQASELNESSFSNSLRFSLGWINIFTPNNTPVYKWANTIRTNVIFAFVQIILILFILYYFFKQKENRNKKYIIIPLAIWFLLMNPLGLMIVYKMAWLGDLLRAASTKLWIFYFIPLLEATGIVIKALQRQKRVYIILGLFVLIFIQAFPWYTGSIFSSNTYVEIPKEYENFYSQLDAEEKVLMIGPDAHLLYFKEFEWGYYGSDFVSYMTKAKTYNTGTINDYPEGIDTKDICSTLDKFDYVTIENNRELDDINCVGVYVLKNTYFSILSKR